MTFSVPLVKSGKFFIHGFAELSTICFISYTQVNIFWFMDYLINEKTVYKFCSGKQKKIWYIRSYKLNLRAKFWLKTNYNLGINVCIYEYLYDYSLKLLKKEIK